MVDRHEPTSDMEPMLISEKGSGYMELQDLVVDLARRSSGFKKSLPPSLVPALARLVRSMNCYYSNLIEGHATHPIDIEKALKSDYSKDIKKRNLQLEAKAHIAVQAWIDEGGIEGRVATKSALFEVHKKFCEALPEELLWNEAPNSDHREKVMPGMIRKVDVRVGQHVPVSPDAIPRFLDRFEDVYGKLGVSGLVLNCAAGHHRILWIHPFLDGNGRVARLLSHAWLLEALDTGALWSIARGLARRVELYKQHLANCDLPRRNDLDGRGPLSTEALHSFAKFFLESCIDQVIFMEEIMETELLKTRITLWAEEQVRLEKLSQRAIRLLETLLYRGSIARKELPAFLGVTDRHARRIVKELAGFGVISSESTRGPLTLAFPATLAGRWMPGLFPDQKES